MANHHSTIRGAASANSAVRVEAGSWLGRLDSGVSERSVPIAAAVLTVAFGWRLWLAQATFFNTDEAWHYALANQDSAWLAYKASLTISHPPLLILILHFWRAVGTSNLILRLPAVIAGTVFCWIFYQWLALVAGRAAAWVGLILAAFLDPMIATSAEVRQNPLLLMFAAGALYFFERALSEESVPAMLASSACLYFAMLSHYSAFFVAGALGVYAIVRIRMQRPSTTVMIAWIAGQTGGVVLAAILYKTHLGRLNSLLNQALLPQQYLFSSYFHKGKDHLLPFLYRGTFGVFRFVFGQTQIGQLAAILFAAGLVILVWGKASTLALARARALGSLLLLPFVLNWLAAAAGLYPYGRMRQCMFLAIFALAGVSVCLGRIGQERSALAIAVALGIVVLCYAFGSLQDHDAIPLADQRHGHMDEAMQFIRSHIMPADVILTDRATSFQLRHYLCRQKPVMIEARPDEQEEFRCEGLKIISTGPNDGALTAENVAERWQDQAWMDGLRPANQLWVVQAGWARGLGEALRRQFPAFARLEVHSFGRYIEVFQLPLQPTEPSQHSQQR